MKIFNWQIFLQRTVILLIIKAGVLSGLCFSQNGSAKLRISELTPGFYIFTTWNTYQGESVPANGMYVVTGEGVVMLDTPWDTSQMQPLLDSIRIKHHKNVVMCIGTHSHADRTGGMVFFNAQNIKTYTGIRTDQILKKQGKTRSRYVIMKDSVFNVGQFRFQTYFPGEGHTSDNIVVWFDREKILFGGCLVKSVEATDLGYTGEANLKAWPKSIDNIQKKFLDPKFVVPGHQSWADTSALGHTLKLLRQ